MSRCPGRHALQRLLAEELYGAERDTLAGHVDGCLDCQQLLAELSEDPETSAWHALLADAASAQPIGRPEFLQRLSQAVPDVPDPGTLAEGAVAVPGYEVLGVLGRGGMGVVYKAQQCGLNRTVALKMVLAGVHAGPERRQRFRVEAEALARLQHPNIVQIHEIGEHAGLPYLVFEYVHGGSLAEQIRGTPQPAPAAAHLVEKLARAVHHAHTQGIVHRDLKPANILLASSGPTTHHSPLTTHQPKITDFGLAKRQGADGATVSGAILGTPSYMAPEQIDGRTGEVGPGTDVYALGAILYELLTGRPPFRAATPLETLRQVTSDDPVPPTRLQPRLPRDLETICLKCLHKEQARRYPSALALAEDLGRFLHGEPIRARPVAALERLAKWARRRPGVAALAALVVIVTAAGLTLTTWQWSRAETHAEAEAAARRAAELLTARSALGTGLTLCEQGEAAHGLHWLVRALDRTVRLSPADADLEECVRLSLAGCRREVHPLRAMFPHEDLIFAAAFSADGQTILAGGRASAARLWDIGTGQPRGTLPHDATLAAAAFSPDGLTALTATHTGVVQRWDVATRQPLGAAWHHPAAVYAVAFSPDGRVVATSCNDGSARLWECASGQVLHTLRHGFPLYAVAFHPGGRLLFTSGADTGVRIWDTDTGQPRGAPLQHPDVEAPIRCLAVAPGGQLLAAGCRDGIVRLWRSAQPTSGAVSYRPSGPVLHDEGVFRSLAFSPDGALLLTGTSLNTARLWDLATATPLGAPLRHGSEVQAVAFGPDGRTFLTAGWDKVTRLWEVAADRARVLTQQGTVNAARFSPDGRLLLAGDESGTLVLWDATTGQPAAPALVHDGAVLGVEFAPDGRTLVSGGGKTVCLWDAASRQRRGVLELEPTELRCRSALFHPDGRRVLIGGTATVRLWDSVTGQPAGPPLRPASEVRAVALSPDGRVAAVGDWDGAVQLWDPVAGVPLGAPLPHRSSVQALAFSSDGATLLTGSTDTTARLWRVATGEPLGPPLQHRHEVDAVALHPGGRLLVLGSRAHVGRVWHIPTGRPVGPPLRHPGRISAVAFHPGGGAVATAGGSNAVCLWPLPAALEGDAARLALWARVVTGLELDEQDGVHRLDADIWHNLVRQLHAGTER